MAWLTRHLLLASQAPTLAAFVQAVAWPGAVIVIIAILRSEVRLMLERIVHLKYHDFEAQFRRDLQLSEGLGANLAVQRLANPSASESRQVSHELNLPHQGGATVPPPLKTASTIESAWAQLVQVVTKAVGPNQVDPARALESRGLLDAGSILLYERLRQLHSQAVARPDWAPAAEVVQRYAELSTALAAAILTHTPVIKPDRA